MACPIGIHVDYHLMEPKFGIDNVSVAIMLTESSQIVESGASDLVYYNITASSSQVKIEYQERTRFQLAIPYNIHINISIVACLCGQHSTMTPTIIPLYYSE
jgi:hypothetical protein